MNENNAYGTGGNNLIDISVLVGDAVKGIRRLWWLYPILAAVISIVLCLGKVNSYVPMYRSSATFTISLENEQSVTGQTTTYSYYYNASVAEQMSTTFPYIISSSVFMDVLKEDLGVSFINGTITAQSIASTNMFTLSVESNSPEDAYNILISVIENYPVIARYVIGDTQMNMQLPPSIPTEPYNSIQLRSSVQWALFASAVLEIGIIALYVFTRKTVKTRKDIKYKLNQHCLGTIGVVRFKKHIKGFDDSVTILNPKVPGVFRESMRSIRIRVLQAAKKHGNVIMVTSTVPDEGKSTVALNLAIEIAKQKKEVALVDCDFRNPTIREIMGINGEDGNLSKIIEEEIEDFTPEKDKKSGVYILGSDKSMNKVMSKKGLKKMGSVVDRLRKEMDYVIIDTPPCGAISDASIIAGFADGVVYVTKQDFVKIGHIINSIQSLANNKVKILGCVLNCAQEGLSGYGYGYYGYGYAYGYGKYGRYGRYGYGYGYGGTKKNRTKNSSEAGAKAFLTKDEEDEK